VTQIVIKRIFIIRWINICENCVSIKKKITQLLNYKKTAIDLCFGIIIIYIFFNIAIICIYYHAFSAVGTVLLWWRLFHFAFLPLNYAILGILNIIGGYAYSVTAILWSRLWQTDRFSIIEKNSRIYDNMTYQYEWTAYHTIYT